MNSRPNDSNAALDKRVYVSQGLFLALVFGFFFFVGSSVLFFQETQSLFVFSGEYLRESLSRPGGPLAYAATFLTQFYAGKFSGALLISVVLTLPGILLYFINRRLVPDISLSWLLPLIPSCLLFVMQANHYHMMEYNLGFLSILLYYLFAVWSQKRHHRILVLILLPFFSYLAGAYALIFSGMFAVHILCHDKGKLKYVYTPLLLTITAASFLIFWKVIFFQPIGQIIWFPLPVLASPAYNTTLLILTGYVVLCPLICRVAVLPFMNRLRRSRYSFAAPVIVLPIALFLVHLEYDPETARVVELERLIYAEDWDGAIRFQETTSSRTRTAQYFYNIALSETDQLCDRLFFGVQDFGPGSLVLPWSLEHLNSGGYFHYAVGLVNEAHRWAYEGMVVYGYRPQNVKILARTSLLNGDYRMARTYVNILKRTIYYRDWAMDLERMIDSPDLIRSDPDLGATFEILPKSNFFIEYNEPQNNLGLLLEAQPDNKRALEYLIAGLLLTKNVEGAANSIKDLQEAGYTRIPRHLEEAALIYARNTSVFPDLGGLTISAETQARFDNYSASYIQARRDFSTMREVMQAGFGNTFWFYLHFS